MTHDVTQDPNGDQLPAQAEELDDFDVEGHGIKEIALGLSAATIVAGGAGAAALAMDNPIPGTTAGVQATVAGVQHDVGEQQAWAERLAGQAGERAGQEVGSALRDADRLATWTTTTLTTTTAPVTDRVGAAVTEAAHLAEQTAADTTDLAQRAVTDPIGTTDRVLDEAIATARETRDTAVATTQQAAEDATDLALATAGDVQQIVAPQVSVTMDDEGTTVQAGAAGASVTVSTG